MGFVPLGPRWAYSSIQDRPPAEAYLLDGESMQANAPEMYHGVFAEPLPGEVLNPQPGHPAGLRDFGSRSTEVDQRTVGDLPLVVEHLGSLPRWLEGEPRDTPSGTTSPPVRRREKVERW